MTNTMLLDRVTALETMTEGRALEIVEQLLSDIKLEMMQSTAKNPSATKAIIKFAQQCKKNMTNFSLAGAFPVKDGKQGICDGFKAIIIDNPIADLPSIDQCQEPIDVTKCYPNRNLCTDLSIDCLPSIPVLKTHISAEKARIKAACESNKRITFTLEDPEHNYKSMFNAEYLLTILECVGTVTEAYYQPRTAKNGYNLAALAISGESIHGLVLPIHA